MDSSSSLLMPHLVLSPTPFLDFKWHSKSLGFYFILLPMTLYNILSIYYVKIIAHVNYRDYKAIDTKFFSQIIIV